MTRTAATAKTQAAKFERLIADHLRDHLDDRIDRRVKNGAKDRGDIGGLRHLGVRIVIEVKYVAAMSLGAWLAEAEIERGNDDAAVAMVIHKRRGHGAAGDQYVTMTVDNLIALLIGARP